MKIAEAFPPGEYLKDELNARRWTQTQFATIIGRPIQVVNQIIKGRKAITPRRQQRSARRLGPHRNFG
jgi:plasmid maintenance system antidote protein VapI